MKPAKSKPKPKGQVFTITLTLDTGDVGWIMSTDEVKEWLENRCEGGSSLGRLKVKSVKEVK